MTKTYMFSRAQLYKLKLSDLRKLATYYNIGYDKETRPDMLVEAILEAQMPFEDQNVDTGTPMSVRIRRIRKQNKGA